MENITNDDLFNQTSNIYDQEQGDIRYFGFSVGIVVFLLGTTGNGVTVWAYKRNKNLQSSFNVLIANLCLIDLFFTVIVIPLLLPGYISGQILYSEAFCSVAGYLYYVTLAASLYNLVAIAVNRYIGVVLAQKYQKLFTGQRLAICISSIWLVPAIVYLPVVIAGAYTWNNTVMRCAITEKASRAIRWYNLILNIIFQAIPLLFLIVAYTAIFREVKRVQAKIKGHRKPRKTIRSTSSASSLRKQKSGNTSDDTGDELQPSSMVEGLAFKPVKTAIPQKDHGSVSHDTSQRGSDETDNATPNEKLPEKNSSDKKAMSYATRPSKRNSIWALLLNNNRHKVDSTLQNEDEKSIPLTSLENDAAFPSIEEKNEMKPFPKMIPLSNIHRKKSISTPNLPTIDLANFDLSRNATINKSAVGQVQRYQDDSNMNMKTQDENNKFYRTLSLKTRRTRTQSDAAYSTASRQSQTLQNKKTRREKPSTSSTLAGEDNHQDAFSQNSMRSKKFSKKGHKLYRSRTQRRKHDRERQLAYSSFMICLGFAICIMPTSTLYLIRMISNITVAPSIILIISCLSWLHAVVNPWIYGYLNPQYRKEYRKIVKYIENQICKKSLEPNKT